MRVLYKLSEAGFGAILRSAHRLHAVIPAESISDIDERDDEVAIAEDPDYFEDSAEADIEAEEGRRVLRRHLRRERSAALVAAFRQSLTSFACSVCNFDFEKRYGEIGRGFVECHHMRPIYEMRPGEKTKISDLVAVCANCHRMLHRQSKMLTPRALQSRLRGGEWSDAGAN
jgi:predicted HNH restriction endonuclease